MKAETLAIFDAELKAMRGVATAVAALGYGRDAVGAPDDVLVRVAGEMAGSLS